MPSVPLIELKLAVRKNHLYALKSVVDTLSDDVGGKLAKSQRLPKEQLFTEAAVALGQLRAAITEALR
jgi:hypothetical protein